MSIVIIAFKGAPRVSEEAKRKEQELDKRLETRVKGSEVIFKYYFIILSLITFVTIELWYC